MKEKLEIPRQENYQKRLIAKSIQDKKKQTLSYTPRRNLKPWTTPLNNSQTLFTRPENKRGKKRGKKNLDEIVRQLKKKKKKKKNFQGATCFGVSTSEVKTMEERAREERERKDLTD